MASLLRKSRSIIYRGDENKTSKDSNDHVKQHIPLPLSTKKSSAGLFQYINRSVKGHRKSRIDLSTAVESEAGVAARQQREQEQQLEKQHSITQLRRRLVRKASTFNLHTRHRSSPQKDLDNHRRSEHLFLDAEEDIVRPWPDRELEQSSAVPNYSSEAAESIRRQASIVTASSERTHITAFAAPARRYTLPASYDEKPLPNPVLNSIDLGIAEAQQEVHRAQHELQVKYPTYRETHTDGLGVWLKMASPGAEPPLPYEKLKHITVEACDTALSSTTSYDHSQTETWNTTIINTILSQLVGETQNPTSNGASSESQSKWKFVVNSTIIQHKSNTIDEKTGKGQGRRGMHSAAGAYWNNETDGMWSFKYEAAEKLGLDVIVGIVWVLVG